MKLLTLQRIAFFAVCLALLAFIVSGCATRPNVTAYNYYDVKPESKACIQSGTQGSQANAIHSPLGQLPDINPNAPAEATATNPDTAKQNTVRSSGLFVCNSQGDRATDVAASNAMEFLKNVRGSSAGQGQTMTKGDASPATGSQSQTPTQTESRTTNMPVAISKMGAVAQTAATPEAAGQAIPAVFELGIRQAKAPVTAAQKSAIDATVAADATETGPAGLDMTLADWKTLKAAYIECPSCLSLTDAERAALQAATGK